MKLVYDKEIKISNGIKVFPVEITADKDVNVKVQIEGINGAVCYNCFVSDFKGNKFFQNVELIKDKPQNFWFSVCDAGAGDICVYSDTGELLEKEQISIVKIDKKCENPFEDIYSLNRLIWINSDRAIDNEVTKPFIPVSYSNKSVKILGRELQFNALGLPKKIVSNFNQGIKICDEQTKILSSDIEFSVGKEQFQNKKTDAKTFNDKMIYTALNKSENFELEVKSKVEFDGFVDYKLTLKCVKDTVVDDIKLTLPIDENCLKYFVGLGKKGGKFNRQIDWKWSEEVNQDCFWIGNVNAGLKIKFKGANYVKPYINIYYNHKKLNKPESWDNAGKGGITFADSIFTAYSGKRTIKSGEKLCFDFELIITPLKEIDLKKQFSMRFFHTMYDSDTWLERAKKGGANIINVHHGNDLNPYINYPFFEIEKLSEFIKDAHNSGILVKLYYTIRELTINLPEFKIFRDLGYEMIAKRNITAESHLWQGEAKQWIIDNVGDDVIPAWRQPLKGVKYKDEYDASVITEGQSRLCNFYVEGLNYLVEHANVDGIYIDDVAYDRNTMKRVRKVLDKKEKAYVDFHQWNHLVGPGGMSNCVNMYMELYPYVDRCWIGEGFDYDEPADFWLVEMSGIPFGQMSEMMNTANQYRGLLFGMTNRLAWETNKSTPEIVWEIFDRYNLGEATLTGWWDNSLKVKSSNQQILVSKYTVEDKIYLAVANFSNEIQETEIIVEDTPNCTLHAPNIENFQTEQSFNGKISLDGGKGLFLILKNQKD